MAFCPVWCKCSWCSLKYLCILTATIWHMTPLPNSMQTLEAFSSGTCKLNNVLVYVILQMAVAWLYMIGFKTANPEYMLPFIMFYFGTYMTFIPYNIYYLITKYNWDGNPNVEVLIMVAMHLVAYSYIFCAGWALYTHLQKVLSDYYHRLPDTSRSDAAEAKIQAIKERYPSCVPFAEN